MNLAERMLDRLSSRITDAARTRVRRELLGYSDRDLASKGFSRQRLEAGNAAWPWRLEQPAPGATRPAAPTPDALLKTRLGREVMRHGAAEADRGYLLA